MVINKEGVMKQIIIILITLVVGIVAGVLLVAPKKVIAAEIELDSAKLNDLQVRAAQLLPDIEDRHLVLLTSKGKTPKTKVEKTIFSCLQPSIDFENRTKALSPEQYRDKGGAIMIQMGSMFTEEHACLNRSIIRKVKVG